MRLASRIRRWVWRRLERRVHAAVDARLEAALRQPQLTGPAAAGGSPGVFPPVEAGPPADPAEHLAQLDRQLRAAVATAADAHRLALEASRAIERILQSEVEIWQAIDTAGTG